MSDAANDVFNGYMQSAARMRLTETALSDVLAVYENAVSAARTDEERFAAMVEVAELRDRGASRDDALSILGVIVIIAGVLGMLAIFSEFGTITVADGRYSTKDVINPVGVGMAIATLISFTIWGVLMIKGAELLRILKDRNLHARVAEFRARGLAPASVPDPEPPQPEDQSSLSQ